MSGITHDDLKRAIQEKYSHPHWITLLEVADASGFDGSRSVDAIAFGLYSSRGWEVYAFECKAHRSDWLKELKSPEKAESFHAIVDKFWIVAPKGVVKKEELPRGWGLIIVSNIADTRGLRARISVQAVNREATQDLLPRPFVAAMLTRMQKKLDHWKQTSVLKETIRQKLSTEYERGVKDGIHESEGGEAVDHLRKLKDRLKTFEDASGISINVYTSTRAAQQLGKRVELINQLEHLGGWNSFVSKSKNLIDTLRKDADDLEKRLAAAEVLRDELQCLDAE